MDSNAKTKYGQTHREGSSVYFTKIESQPTVVGVIEVRSSTSPNIKWLVIGIVSTLVVLSVIGGIFAAVVVRSQADNDQNDNTDINECVEADPCLNGATCENTEGSFMCYCDVGWEGPLCETDINECQLNNPCDNGATCINSAGSYICQCTDGWTDIHCDLDINECVESDPCLNGATCENNEGSFMCDCDIGWTGPLCETDINECTAASPACENGGGCDNTPGSFTCNCPPGWTADRCQTDINECDPAVMNNPCENGGICSNTQGGFTCQCPPGWTGVLCRTDINECVGANPCSNGGRCINEDGSYTCECTVEWTGNNCDQDINECSGTNPCDNDGVCENNQGSFTCVCPSGWTGELCSQDINECSEPTCENGGTCENLPGSFTCTCTSGWTGSRCQSDINECDDTLCQHGATCINEAGGVRCECTPFWTGITCETDINECTEGTTVCENGGSCVNTEGSSFCSCAGGWKGDDCTTDINECDLAVMDNPCQNGGICSNIDGSYTCECIDGWIGENCMTGLDYDTSSTTLSYSTGISSTTLSSGTSSMTTDASTVAPADGGWFPWNEWLSCSTTCGTGIQRRYRSCSNNSIFCEGDYIETAVCTIGQCPEYGVWSSWSSWGGCTVSCGGGSQSRTRSCNITQPSHLDCVGNDRQSKTCSVWNCPDCSQTCTNSTLNPECDTCICDENIVDGRVVSNTTGFPIGGAMVYASTAPTTMVTVTNSTGFFTLTTMCVSASLLVIREGFVDTSVMIDSNNIEIRMKPIVLPFFTRPPSSKYRLSGESVTMCCAASASPAIDYYEWFKDLLLIGVTDSTNDTLITLDNLTPSDSGDYQCRANSPYGAKMSSVARLDVKENPDDFCENALEQKLTTLPDGCLNPHTNDTLYEVGECAAQRCRLNTSNTDGVCGDTTYSCCVTTESEVKTIQCIDFEIQVFVIKACGCAQCVTPSLKITGNVVDTEDSSPVAFAEVWVNGEYTTFTSSVGSFSFRVQSESADQLNIFINDAYLQEYLPTTKVLKLSPDMTGMVHVVIKLFKASDPTELDPALENSLVAGTTDGGSPIVQIDIPSNAFYTVDGTLYTDTVAASLTFLDPTNMTVLENIPGVFEFTDTEGQQGALDSYGVFNLYFRGSDGQPLVLGTTIDLYLPSDIDSGDEEEKIQLWRLNTNTGVWDYVSSGPGTNKRKRRQAYRKYIASLGHISSQEWLNYDQIRRRSDACFYKLRLFENDEFKNPAKSTRSVNVHTVSVVNRRMRVTYEAIYPNSCASVICDNNDANIYAYTYPNSRNRILDLFAAQPYGNNIPEHTIPDVRTLKIKMKQSADGPLFNSWPTCSASNEQASHLRYHFGFDTNTQDWEAKKTFTPPRPPFSNEQMKNSQLAWYPNRIEGYRACYLKVRLDLSGVTGSITSTMILKTISKGGTVDAVIGKVYGIRKMKIDPPTSQTVCIEYKCSGNMAPFYPDTIDTTNVEVKFEYIESRMSCTMTGSAGMGTYHDAAQSDTSAGLYEFNPPIASAADIGIYHATDDSYQTANTNAEQSCRTGGSTSPDVPEDPLTGVGITVTCTTMLGDPKILL